MIKTIAFYGIAGALVVGSFMVTAMLPGPGETAPRESGGIVLGYLTQVVALTTVFMGIKSYRDNMLGGVIKFLPALGVGLAISAIATLGWVISWEIVLAITHFDFGAVMKAQMIAQAHASGATAEQLAKVTKDADDFARTYAIPPIRWAMSSVEMFPTGVIVSLVSAGLLRNSRFMPVPRNAN